MNNQTERLYRLHEKWRKTVCCNGHGNHHCIGIFIYLVSRDKKISKLEKEIAINFKKYSELRGLKNQSLDNK